ncbi:TPA: type I toxin-antitoxin system Ibs family toxin, partial [Escherichia coli]
MMKLLIIVVLLVISYP